jgi:cytochrome P450
MGFDAILVNAPYGDRWRRMRRALHPHVAPGALPAYEAVQLRGARQLLADLLAAPHDFLRHNRTCVRARRAAAAAAAAARR